MDPRVEPSNPAEVWDEGEAPTSAPQPPQGIGVRRAIGPYIWTLLAVLGSLEVVRAWSPTAGEPLVLRWSRTCADHPVRTALAALLLVRSLRGPRRAA